MEVSTENSKRKRKTREMHDYKFALWLDGKGFVKEGMGFTLESSDAKVYTRSAEVRAACSFLKNNLGVSDCKIVEFK